MNNSIIKTLSKKDKHDLKVMLEFLDILKPHVDSRAYWVIRNEIFAKLK